MPEFNLPCCIFSPRVLLCTVIEETSWVHCCKQQPSMYLQTSEQIWSLQSFLTGPDLCPGQSVPSCFSVMLFCLDTHGFGEEAYLVDLSSSWVLKTFLYRPASISQVAIQLICHVLISRSSSTQKSSFCSWRLKFLGELVIACFLSLRDKCRVVLPISDDSRWPARP